MGVRWYVDAVSTSSVNESFEMEFHKATRPGRSAPTMLFASIAVTFENGTKFSTWINGTHITGSPIKTQSDRIWGDWSGTGFSFQGSGTDGLAKYVIEGSNPTHGVSGSMVLDSVCPSS